MFISDLISRNVPQLALTDKVAKALSLMEDFELSHLCILQKDKFIGMVCKEDLQQADEQANIESLQEHFIHHLVLESEYFGKALALIADHNLSLLPVLSHEKDFNGVIVSSQLLHQLSKYLEAAIPGGIIILEMDRRNYSFSEICRLVETHDALITQLHTQTNTETGMMLVHVKLNKTEIADIISTLQRFEYNIISYYGEEAYTNELQENFDHLLHYLNI
jgi:predicted transcriptional regulator